MIALHVTCYRQRRHHEAINNRRTAPARHATERIRFRLLSILRPARRGRHLQRLFATRAGSAICDPPGAMLAFLRANNSIRPGGNNVTKKNQLPRRQFVGE